MIPVYTVKLEKTRSIWGQEKVRYTGKAISILPLLRRYLSRVDREHHVVVLLDTQQKVIGLTTIGIGTLTSVLVHPREVFKPAVVGNAYSIIVCHNHPSDNPNPSPADRTTHAMLEDASRALGIPLEDDIIVDELGLYFSFKEETDRQIRRQLQTERETACSKARKRIDQGGGSRRDVVLLAANRLAKVPGMTRAEATDELRIVCSELKPIAETTARIRKVVRKRAKDLLQVATGMQETGSFLNISELTAVLTWDEAPPKPYTMPIADFFEPPK